MSRAFVLYFTAHERSLYHCERGSLRHETTFSEDERGAAEFREFLRRRKGALVSIVADLAGEDFHDDEIPHLRGRDRRMVIERRLGQRYRDARLAGALSLGAIAGTRRNERILLASFTNVQQFMPWLDALAETDAKLSGIYSTAILAPALGARLGAGGGRCILVASNSAGLRQCFLEGGRLRFARLEPGGQADPDILAVSVRAETERLSQYLVTLRALPREGPPIDVLVIAPDGADERFHRALASDARFAFRVIGVTDAAHKVGLRRPARGIGAEQLFLHLAATRPPTEQFARVEDRRRFVLWRMQRAIVAAGALGLAACAAYAGTLWLEATATREQTEDFRREARITQQQLNRIIADFPVTQTSTDNLKATVLGFRNLAARTGSPEGALAFLSHALERFPEIELDAVTWSVRSAADAGDAKSSAPEPGRAAAADLWQTMEIAAHLTAEPDTDYRATMAQVQRFAAQLTTDSNWQIVRTHLPYDATPEGTLIGDPSEARKMDRLRFTLVIARAR